MALGAINHLALSVSDLDRSRDFYRPILEFLGYRLSLDTEALNVWESVSTGTAVNFWRAKPQFAKQRHQRYVAGLHHLAFNADTAEQVDRFCALLMTLDVEILDPPAIYHEYAPGYYAVFFRDPDGLKLELAHIPGLECGP